MTEKYESKFHKQYVGGDGEVEDNKSFEVKKGDYKETSIEDVLLFYRKYVNDPKAELPEGVIDTFFVKRKIGE